MSKEHLPNNNSGIVNLGGTNTFSGNAVGNGARSTNISYPVNAGARDEPSITEIDRWDLGVVTILPVETRAAIDAFNLTREPDSGGLYFRTGMVSENGDPLRVAALQTHSPGQRSVMSALGHLHRRFAPRRWVLLGIGGGLDPVDARIGNVIVSTRVVYYDQRKITEGEVVHYRGEEREAPAEIVHAVNAYFTDHGSPAPIRGQAAGYETEPYSVLPGLIGSGEAVIAARDSGVRGYLKHYNDKILAVDMESGGLSQYWQENSVGETSNPSWVVVRGISDNADQAKNDDGHDLAARNAAHVVRELLPYLC